MSHAKNDIYIENLIQQYHELMALWDGKDLALEKKINDIAGELSDLGIDVEDLQ